MALSAYFDESGTDDSNSSVVVAGFASTVEQWKRFDTEWTGVLKEFGSPPFHAKDFDDARRGFGPYSEWKASKRNEFFARLLGVIVRRAERSIGTVLSKAAYEATVQRMELLRRYFGTPYAFCCFNCLHQTRAWRERYHSKLPVLYVFDKGNRNEGELVNTSDMLKGYDDFMVDLTTGDDRKLPALQAADLLAFELCSEARRQAKNERRDSRYGLQRLDEHPHDWVKVSEDNLMDISLKVLHLMAASNPVLAGALQLAESEAKKALGLS